MRAAFARHVRPEHLVTVVVAEIEAGGATRRPAVSGRLRIVGVNGVAACSPSRRRRVASDAGSCARDAVQLARRDPAGLPVSTFSQAAVRWGWRRLRVAPEKWCWWSAPPRVADALDSNIRLLQGAGRVELLRQDALKFASSSSRAFDVVFLDPPYRQGWLDRLTPFLPRLPEDGRCTVRRSRGSAGVAG